MFLQPQTWIISDKNKDIMNIWKTVSMTDAKYNIGHEIIVLGQEILDGDHKEKAKELISILEKNKLGPKRAALYLTINNCAYMGILTNKTGFFFNGFEGCFYKKGKPSFMEESYQNNLEDVRSFVTNSKGIMKACDYKKTLEQAKQGDFVFLDPPYVEDKNYKFVYNRCDNLFDYQDLLDSLKELDRKGVMWMMTQADTPGVRKMFEGYRLKTFRVYRRKSRTHKNELIVMNYR